MNYLNRQLASPLFNPNAGRLAAAPPIKRNAPAEEVISPGDAASEQAARSSTSPAKEWEEPIRTLVKAVGIQLEINKMEGWLKQLEHAQKTAQTQPTDAKILATFQSRISGARKALKDLEDASTKHIEDLGRKFALIVNSRATTAALASTNAAPGIVASGASKMQMQGTASNSDELRQLKSALGSSQKRIADLEVKLVEMKTKVDAVEPRLEAQALALQRLDDRIQHSADETYRRFSALESVPSRDPRSQHAQGSNVVSTGTGPMRSSTSGTPNPYSTSQPTTTENLRQRLEVLEGSMAKLLRSRDRESKSDRRRSDTQIASTADHRLLENAGEPGVPAASFVSRIVALEARLRSSEGDSIEQLRADHNNEMTSRIRLQDEVNALKDWKHNFLMNEFREWKTAIPSLEEGSQNADRSLEELYSYVAQQQAKERAPNEIDDAMD